MISPSGEVVAEAPLARPGDEPEPEVLIADLDLAAGMSAAADAEVLFTDREAGATVIFVEAAPPLEIA